MQERPVQPFFHFGINWLVAALPLSAVIAGFATLGLALTAPDPLLRVDGRSPEQRPAVEGRNHAATGGKPLSAAQAAPAR